MTTFNLSGPALAPPPGVTPNFAHPPNRNGVAAAALVVMMVVATACLCIRAVGKLVLAKNIVVADVMIFAAYGNFIGAFWAACALLTTPGYFVHNWDLLLGETIKPYYYIFVFGVFYSVVLALLKVAIVVEWLRTFGPRPTGQHAYLWWGCMAVATLQAAFGVAAIFLLVFQCVPHEAIWDFTVPARCLPLNPLQLTSSTVHIVSDVCMLLLPQKVIWELNMSLHKRMGVALIFGLGVVAAVSSIMRLVETIAFGRSDDKLYTIGPVVLWAVGEQACGFFVACTPVLPAVLKHTGAAAAVRRCLGLRPSSTAASGPRSAGSAGALATFGGTGGAKGPARRARGGGPDTYVEIDDDGVPLEGLKADDDDAATCLAKSESTEELRGEHDPERGLSPKMAARVAHVAVVRDGDSSGSSDCGGSGRGP